MEQSITEEKEWIKIINSACNYAIHWYIAGHHKLIKVVQIFDNLWDEIDVTC